MFRLNQRWGQAALVLVILGIVMIVLGISAQLAPPAITGLGFLAVAWGFSGPSAEARGPRPDA